jgi:tRNA-modifying protein YgfZ
VTLLGAERSLLAGYHNPQGRVIALLRLVQLAPGDVIAVLPRELISTVAQRLAKFILRAKVKLADESGEWLITGVLNAPAAADDWPASLDGAARSGQSIAVRVALQPARWLLVSPTAHPLSLTGCTHATADDWLRLAIAAGEPEVRAATSEEFVAQMLNLDAVGAIAFDKGCYTGQEVIARAHYRGRVKRRLQRFRTRDSRQLTPGDAGELSDGRAFKVVSAVALPDGGREFLAVVPLSAEDSGPPRPAPAAAASALEVEQLALGYTLPS